MSEDYPDFIVSIEGIDHTCHPICRQPYRDCYFEAGFIDNHPKDPMYLLLSRDGVETFIYLRSDEVAAIAWVLIGLIWADEMNGGASNLLMMLGAERMQKEIAVEALENEYNQHEHIDNEYAQGAAKIASDALAEIAKMEAQNER